MSDAKLVEENAFFSTKNVMGTCATLSRGVNELEPSKPREACSETFAHTDSTYKHNADGFDIFHLVEANLKQTE